MQSQAHPLAASLARRALLTALLTASAYATPAAQAEPPLPRLTRLTESPGTFDLWPCFAPDGAEVLCCRTSDLRSFELVSVAVQDGSERSFASVELDFEPTRPNWHWASNRIALTGIEPDDSRGIWVMDARDGSVEPIREEALGSQCFYPCWSSDGRSLVVTDFEVNGRGTVKRVQLASRIVRPLTDPAAVLAGRAWESPRDAAVVFAGQANRGEPYDQLANRLFEVTADGGVRQLFDGIGRAPCFSPDGRWIAFESSVGDIDRTDGRERYAIMLMAAVGGPLVRLTPYALNAQHPSWSPDGSRIVCFTEFASGKRGLGLMLIDELVFPASGSTDAHNQTPAVRK